VEIEFLHSELSITVMDILQFDSVCIQSYINSPVLYVVQLHIGINFFHQALNSLGCHCAEQFVHYCYFSCISDFNEMWKNRI